MGDDQGQAHQLRFTVLGPVRAWRGDEQLSTGSPQQRALLAALLLRDGRTATAAELVDGLWGDEPPEAAIATLRTYASRLRKSFGADSASLVSESGGYALRVRAEALDLDRAERLATEAEKARAAGERAVACDLITEALDLWDGEPLAGLPGPYVENQRARLLEWRISLVETRLDLEMELGHHTETISELTALTAVHPLRERLRELLMLGLYRSGRQAEALAVYADTRRLLADELGVEPRPELAALQQRILQGDSSLSAQAPGGQAKVQPTFVRPAQLPASVADFTGRAGFVIELSNQLNTAEGSVMAVSAVAGIGGVGKTTLAVHVAHAARHHFPDGQLYVDLQGAGPVVSEPGAVLGSFLRALGTPDEAIPDTLEDRAALYRSTLAGRRILTLLDNAHDAAQVRPLLPGTEGCAALITSRSRMVDLESAHLVDLDVMSPEEALILFTRIVGEDRTAGERDAVMDVVAACGFLPLAIRIAASRLAARRTWTVSVLARKLADQRHRLDELQAGDLAVKATFELGYDQLEPQQARAFRLLGLADGPDISLAAAAAMLDLDTYATETLLESIVDTSLLESAAPGRYRFHDLVRLYARACAERDELPPAERDAALSRLLDFYLASASQVFAHARPGDRLIEHLEKTSHPGLAFLDRTAAIDWLFVEAGCLLASIQQFASGGTLRRATDLLLACKDLAESGANSRQYETAALVVREAAQAATDARAEGRARMMVTHTHRLASRFNQADAEAQRAIELAHSVNDPVPACEALNDRGIIALYQKRHEDSEKYFRQALDAFRADDNLPGVAGALSNISRAHAAMGHIESAIELAAEGVAVYSSLGLGLRVANGRYAMGLALFQGKRYVEALEQLTEALALFRDNRQRLWEGSTHARLAEVHLAAQRPAEAATNAERALALRLVGGEWRRGTVLTVLGKALQGLGQVDRARACWAEALAIHERLHAVEAEEVRLLLAPTAAA
ncbi:BTAD domain-containing putative transcriptional regulator [Streptomyces sp. NPDC057702]|uniref:AfsR/SARP family transcriptional regulator n=1 Tax=unclassified Streptomyces TaxID=2593676 RepID=UPI0036BE2737